MIEERPPGGNWKQRRGDSDGRRGTVIDGSGRPEGTGVRQSEKSRPLSRIKNCFIVNEDNPAPGRGAGALNLFLVLALLVGLFWFGFSRLNYPFHWDSIWRYRVSFLSGFRMTILISVFSLFLSILIGVFFGIARDLPFVPLRVLSRVYVEGIRGTPLLVQILIFFYVIANAMGVNNRFVVGIIIMSIFSGAYIAEIIRSGVESIGES